MKSSQPAPNRIRPPALRRELEKQLSLFTDTCLDCPQCAAECAFLEKYGTPKAIAAAYDPGETAWLTIPFECSLCDLCAGVCPVKLTPGSLFLEMRREAVARKAAPLPAHKGIMAYERRGISKKYSWYSLPENCHTVFFPGCAFAGTRMDTTIALYEHLKTIAPGMGIVLDCCCKPSHDLGREAFFREVFAEMKDWLVAKGVKTIIVACPNCYCVLNTYGDPLNTISVYEFLSKNGIPSPAHEKADGVSRRPVSIHDPCVLRNEGAIQTAVRALAASSGFPIEEMPHSRGTTLCCGEGGAVGSVTPELAARWGTIRREEAGGRRLLTCCAGCAGFLNRKTPTDHILDAIFYPEAVAAGKRKATRAPLTYINRLRLKHYLQKNHPAPVTRERDFSPASEAPNGRGNKFLKIIMVLLIAAAIAVIRLAVIHQYFDFT